VRKAWGYNEVGAQEVLLGDFCYGPFAETHEVLESVKLVCTVSRRLDKMENKYINQAPLYVCDCNIRIVPRSRTWSCGNPKFLFCIQGGNGMLRDSFTLD